MPLGDVVGDLETLYGLLVPGGMLLLPVRNPGSAYELDCLIHGGTRVIYAEEKEVKPYRSISYRQLLSALYEHPLLHHYETDAITFPVDSVLAERMKSLLRLDENSFPDVEMSLFVRMFFLGIFKEALINSTTPS